MNPVALVKNGETVIQYEISRRKKRSSDVGYVVTAYADASVEEFFRQMVEGEEPQPIAAWGRQWTPNGDSPLLAYGISEELSGIRGKNTTYRLDFVGKGPLLLTEGKSQVANLSFLRLVGITNGVSFGVRGVYELDTLRASQDLVMRAAASFYEQYLKPINLTVQVSTQEWVPVQHEPEVTPSLG